MGLDRIADFGKDIIDFERVHLKEMARKIKEEPNRLLSPVPMVDPLGTKIGEAHGLGGDDPQPLVDEWGGPDQSTWDRARDEGVNLPPNEFMHGVARTIAQSQAMSYGEGAAADFGAEQGWDPKVVEYGIKALKAGANAATGQETIGEGLLMPKRPERQFGAPVDTFGMARPEIATESGAPGAAITPGAQPTFSAPVPSPPEQPGTRRY